MPQTRNYRMILVTSGAPWFLDVQQRWTTPNSCQPSPQAWIDSCVVLWFEQSQTTTNSWEIILWFLLPLELSGSRRFEPHQSHVKLLCRSGSLCCAKVWTGSEENSVSSQALPTELQVFLITFMGRWPMPIAGIGAISHFPLIWSHDPTYLITWCPSHLLNVTCVTMLFPLSFQDTKDEPNKWACSFSCSCCFNAIMKPFKWLLECNLLIL